MATESAERRRKRKEIRLMNSESVWLQKALFAVRKAEEARDKLADARDEDPEPYTMPVDGNELSMEALEDALEARAKKLRETVKERRRDLR